MLRKTVICLSFLLFCPLSLAANNPGYSTFGSSSGTTEISITRDPSAGPGPGIRISNLNDFDFGILAGSPISLADEICIFSSTGNYEITTYSLHNDGTGGHQLKDTGTTNTFINYDVGWDDLQGNGFLDIDHGVTAGNLSGADNTDLDCGNGTTALLRITINPLDFSNATFGIRYSDTLTITAGIL